MHISAPRLTQPGTISWSNNGYLKCNLIYILCGSNWQNNFYNSWAALVVYEGAIIMFTWNLKIGIFSLPITKYFSLFSLINITCYNGFLLYFTVTHMVAFYFIIPVSYTHLDVYKRQGFMCFPPYFFCSTKDQLY